MTMETLLADATPLSTVRSISQVHTHLSMYTQIVHIVIFQAKKYDLFSLKEILTICCEFFPESLSCLINIGFCL